MVVAPPSPDRVRLEQDLITAEFDAGVRAGQWRLAELRWPALFVGVTVGAVGELGLRLAVDGYPALAPAGQPWDLDRDGPLPAARWPTSGVGVEVFRLDWSIQNGNAPYLACDRIPLQSHPGWLVEDPPRAWHANRTVTFYLSELWRELQAATLAPAASGTSR